MARKDTGGKLPPKIDILQETYEKLEQGIQDMFQSEAYKTYLKVMSRFHAYSFNNTILIAIQKPDARLVAGYTSWNNKFGRQVKKGEKGIKIFAPAPVKITVQQIVKDDKGEAIKDRSGKAIKEEVEKIIPKYKVVNVFDVSQTEGKELPTLGVESLQGAVHHFDEILAAIRDVSPVPIRFEDIKSGAKGYYSRAENVIAIANGLEQLQTIKTALHEVAHSVLHNKEQVQEKKLDANTREVQAESVAYAVCDYFGLDTSDYSFAYIGGWSKGTSLLELKSSLEIIKSTAQTMITGIEQKLERLQNKSVEQKQEMAMAEAITENQEKKKPSIRKQLDGKAKSERKKTLQTGKRKEIER